ncbi:MAG: putative glycosyl transferase [Smithella sp. PtaU1.Bin162]|nr:MAG: putative glycosyl transferase [Smithella sp. PtaU1.Bin162]
MDGNKIFQMEYNSAGNVEKMNIIFFGQYSYPQGMAGTKRIQHAISALKKCQGIRISVVILTQSSRDNTLTGSYMGINYKTILGDLYGIKTVLFSPILCLKTCHVLKESFCPNQNNIIYNYGPPDLFNIGILSYAKQLGYKIVFDIVEDYDTAMSISHSSSHKIKTFNIRFLVRYIKYWAAGIIVISSHLQRKYQDLSRNQIPVHYRPISVDFRHYSTSISDFGDPVTLFYSGSFGIKDGLPLLLSAFDNVAARNSNVRLVLTGKGSREAMGATFSRIAGSPFKQRIEYKGYLNDDAYYSTLNSIDIPCMTRIDSAYANAGFPFKLGEYLASGKPVIASHISDVSRFLVHKRDAILVKPGDCMDIANAVEYLLNHPEEARLIGESGREKARVHFDYNEQGQKLLNYLRSI